MSLYHILSRLSHEEIYVNSGNPQVYLKDLLEEESSVFLPDTNCLALGFNFLKESIGNVSQKEEGLHHVHGQIKALKELGYQRRLKVLPKIQKEFNLFHEDFTRLIIENRFKYASHKHVDRGLFQLFSDVRDLGYLVASCVDEELEQNAQILFANNDVSSQLITSYSKGNEIKQVSNEDLLLYLAGIVSHNSTSALGYPTYMLTSDIDFLVQPPISLQGKMHSVPIYFPSRPTLGKLRNNTFSKFEHKPRGHIVAHSFYNLG